MPGNGLWLRAFLGLLLAVLPPLLLLVGALLLTDTVLSEANPDLVALFVMVGSIVWAAVLAGVYARSINEDVRSLLSLAQRGDPDAGAARDDAYRSLASSLDERNRQVGTLARVSREMAIDQAPRGVVLALVESVVTVMRDPTWRCAVLTSSLPELLPVGIYSPSDTDGEAAVAPIGDLERWAADRVPRRRRAEGRRPVGRVRGRRRRRRERCPGDPLRAVGGPRGPEPVGAGPSAPHRSTRGGRHRALAALRAAPGADR